MHDWFPDRASSNFIYNIIKNQIGIIFSILQIIYRVQTPYVCTLGRVGETDIYKDLKAYDEAKEIPQVKIIRFESFLFFGNLEFFKKNLCKMSGINPLAYNQQKTKVDFLEGEM